MTKENGRGRKEKTGPGDGLWRLLVLLKLSPRRAPWQAGGKKGRPLGSRLTLGYVALFVAAVAGNRGRPDALSSRERKKEKSQRTTRAALHHHRRFGLAPPRGKERDYVALPTNDCILDRYAYLGIDGGRERGNQFQARGGQVMLSSSITVRRRAEHRRGGEKERFTPY